MPAVLLFVGAWALAAGASAGGRDAVMLVQQNAKGLPTVEAVLAKPRGVLAAIGDHISDLQARMADMQQKSNETLVKQSAEFEATLKAQREAIGNAQARNAQLAASLQSLNQTSRALLLRAQFLSKEVQLYEGHGRALKANLSSAQEFIAIALSFASERLDLESNPQLEVLKDLNEQDRLSLEAKAEANRFSAITAETSLLQVASEPRSRTPEQDAQELVDMLVASMDELKAEQNASEVELSRRYGSELEKGNATLEALGREGARLLGEVASAKELKARLSKAVKHLAAVRDRVKERIADLRSFIGLVGRRRVPDAPKAKKALEPRSKAKKMQRGAEVAAAARVAEAKAPKRADASKVS